jgi:hypothetical protein
MKAYFAQSVRAAVAAAAAMLAATGAYAFIWLGVYRAQRAVLVYRADGAEVREMRARASALSRSLDETARERAALAGAFVGSGDAVPFIEAIESLARESGVSVRFEEVAESGEGENGSGFTLVHFKLATEGAFRSLLSFVRLLETMPYAARISEVALEAPSGAPGATDAGQGAEAAPWRAGIILEVLRRAERLP